MEESAEIVEVIEEETELSPTHTGLVTQEISQNRQSSEDMLWLAENIESLVAAKKKITTTILKMALPGDWVSFSSDNDQNGTASLGYAGAMRIAETCGISFLDRKVKKITGTDKDGEWFRYEAEVTCTRGSRQVRTWGRAGSRDVFFGKADGKWKDISQINDGNCHIAAIRGALKEGVKILLGMPNFPIKDLLQMGVNIDFTKGHSFKSKSTEKNNIGQTAENEALVRAKMRDMLFELSAEDQKKAGDILEAMSSFEGNDGLVKGKRILDYLKGSWLLSTYAKIKAEYKKKFGKDYVYQPELVK